MQIILYTESIRDYSGVNTFERHLLNLLRKKYDVRYVTKYNYTSNKVAEEVHHQSLECDICIYSSIFHTIKIKAKKYIQITHADLKAWNCELPNTRIDQYIAVSSFVQKKLKEDFNIESIVIPGFLPKSRPSKVLRLVTASRIKSGKGFDRMLKLAHKLKEQNRDFIWEIYGEGDDTIKDWFSNYPEIRFMGVKTDIQAYMKGADYLVQLSDNEGYCYSIREALQIGIPCIVTNWEGVEDVIKDGINGIILGMDLENLSIEEFYIKKFKNIDFKSDTNKIKKLWNDVIMI